MGALYRQSWTSFILFLTALLFFPAFAQDQDLNEIIERSFDVKPGGMLVVDSDRGSIEVRSSGEDAVTVKAIRRPQAWSQDEEMEMMRNFRIEFQQSGNTVTVTGDDLKKRFNNWWGRKRKMQVAFVVTVPEKFNVDLRTSGGSIEVDDLNGEVEAHTAGGSLNFGNISGKVYAKTAGGSIRLRGSDADVYVKTAGGSISIGEVSGNVEAYTAGGKISIDAAGGNVEANTSGGKIEVYEVFGNINAKTSGGSVLAYILGQPKGDCSLSTSGGNVIVYLSEDVAVDISAKASGSSRIKTDFAVKGEIGKSRIRGDINGGGPLLNLRTSSGRIEIRKSSERVRQHSRRN